MRSAQQMFECIVKYGCTDLTSSTDSDRSASPVIASGGFGGVRGVTLDDGTYAALKTLRLKILLKDVDKAIKVLYTSRFSIALLLLVS